ncbi:MAG: AtpZ/AtpI family protein [Rhodospirillaceae bacterium]|nr:AtpZ/AtpI family protein [Rhodospirillaceae bacterium]
MPDKDKPPELAGLEARLQEAESRRTAGSKPDSERGKGLSFAFRIGTELVAGIAVGVGIGWQLDGWLGTRPWLMIAFFVLGAAAGMMNVYRSAAGLGHQVGYKPARGDAQAKGDEKRGGGQG